MVDDFIQNRLDFGDVHSVAEQGLKVVTAQFKGVEPFSWNVFDGFDRMRVLTYSASTQMIVRMLDRFPFAFFECVFGYEGGLRRVAALGPLTLAVPDEEEVGGARGGSLARSSSA